MQYSLRCDGILWVVSCFLVLARLARDRSRTHMSSSSGEFSMEGLSSPTSSEDRPDGSQAVRAGLVWRGSCDVLPLLGQEVLLSYRVSFREEDFAQSLIYKGTAVSASLFVKDGEARSGRCRGWLLVEDFPMFCMDIVTLFGSGNVTMTGSARAPAHGSRPVVLFS